MPEMKKNSENNSSLDIDSHEYALKHSKNIQEQDWYEAINQKDFNSALQTLEKKNDHSIIEKLWWIRCQLNLKLLPASTLVTPLEEAYEKINDDSNLLAASTYLNASKSLIKGKQTRLAVLTSRKAFELLKESEISKVYKESLEREIKSASEKKQSTKYINELEDELKTLSSINLVEKPREEYTIDRVSDDETTKKTEVNAIDTSHVDKTIKTKKKAKKTFPLGYILAGLFFILLGLSYSFIFTKESSLLTNIDYNIKVPNPITPKSELSKDSSLEDLDLTETTEEPKLSEVEKRITSIQTNEEKIEESEIVEDLQAEQTQEDTPITSSDTSVKTEDYSEDIDLEPIPKGKIPNIETRENTQLPELIEQSPRRVAPTLPESSRGIKAYDVERFDPPLKYKTITSTEVLSAPSLLSNSLARLKTDTHILVVRKMGLWLEIQSTQGSIGYIYAQDASRL